MRILVCVLERHMQRLIQVNLSRQSYDVEVAETGAAAMEAIENRTPDLVVLDVRLPDMTGEELLLRICQHPKGKDIRVIKLGQREDWPNHGDDDPDQPSMLLTGHSELGKIIELSGLRD